MKRKTHRLRIEVLMFRRSDPEKLAEQIYWQIGVKRVRAVEDTCKAKRLNIVQAPELQSWGEWIMKVRSPNGIFVGFEGDE